MSVKFNNLGQWSLVGDGGKELIKGWEAPKDGPASRHNKAEFNKGIDEFAKVANGNLPINGLSKAVKPQPTNEELFGHLVVSEDMLKAKDKEWNELSFASKIKEASKPIDHLNKHKSGSLSKTWGNGASFNSLLSKEELDERRMSTDGPETYITPTKE